MEFAIWSLLELFDITILGMWFDYFYLIDFMYEGSNKLDKIYFNYFRYEGFWFNLLLVYPC